MSLKNYFDNEFKKDFRHVSNLISKDWDRDVDIFKRQFAPEPTTHVHVKGTDSHEVHMLVPGFNKDQITITFEKGTLKVAAMRKHNIDAEIMKMLPSTYALNLYIGDVVEDSIAAKLENGVLIVQLPLLQKEVTKIKIN